MNPRSLSAILTSALTSAMLIALSANAMALQNKVIDDDSEITAEISKGELNRIKVEGDRIKGAKYNSGDLEVSSEKSLGELYLKPTANTSSKPINIFIVTEKGQTYKLLLYPRSIPGEQIFLSPGFSTKDSDSKASDSVSTTSTKPVRITKDSYQSQIVALIKAMRNRSVLEGYKISNRKAKARLGDLHLRRIATYQGSKLIGEVFSVKNNTNTDLNLNEKQFVTDGVGAVKIESSSLSPGEVTEVFIVS